MWNRFASWLFACSLTAGALGCASVVLVEKDDDVDDGSAGGETDGTAAGGHRDDPTEPVPPWTSACPPPSDLVPPDHGGACSNAPDGGVLSLQDAEDLLFRLTHEAGHIAGLAVMIDSAPFTSEPGGAFAAQNDDGYAIGQWGPPEGDSTCAAVELRCWTGGHGGWGPSALAGAALISVDVEDGVVTRVRIQSDSLWLVEDGPLAGTPKTQVSVEMEIAAGEVDHVFATVGDHVIDR